MKYVVNEEGEVLNEIEDEGNVVILRAGDRVIRGDSIHSYRSRIANASKMDYRFIKINDRHIYSASRGVPLFTALLSFINYEDNLLMFSNGKSINASNLSRYTKMSYSTCRRQLDTLVERDVIKKVRSNNKILYYFNPYIAIRGKYISNNTLSMFRESEYREDK